MRRPGDTWHNLKLGDTVADIPPKIPLNIYFNTPIWKSGKCCAMFLRGDGMEGHFPPEGLWELIEKEADRKAMTLAPAPQWLCVYVDSADQFDRVINRLRPFFEFRLQKALDDEPRDGESISERELKDRVRRAIDPDFPGKQ